MWLRELGLAVRIHLALYASAVIAGFVMTRAWTSLDAGSLALLSVPPALAFVGLTVLALVARIYSGGHVPGAYVPLLSATFVVGCWVVSRLGSTVGAAIYRPDGIRRLDLAWSSPSVGLAAWVACGLAMLLVRRGTPSEVRR